MPTFHHTTGAVQVGRVDGNAAAGPLSEVFAVDLTAAVIVCRHCQARGPFAETVAEIDDDGCVIVLCRSCSRTLLTMVSGRGGRTLSCPGLASLELADET